MNFVLKGYNLLATRISQLETDASVEEEEERAICMISNLTGRKYDL